MVVLLEVENVRANFGDAAASEKLMAMGERCAEPGCDFCTRPPAVPMPVERILRMTLSLLPPGEGMGAEYEALRIAVELRLIGRFCRLAAILDDWSGSENSSGVLFLMCIASMLVARLLVDEFLRPKASSRKCTGMSRSEGAALSLRACSGVVMMACEDEFSC